MGAYGGQYRMNVVWSSHAGQVLTTMGQIQSGMRTTGGVAQRSSRDLGAFNRQMNAVGTTFRYMFAGGAIFGSMNAFRQFAEFESKLGDIAAISENINVQNLGNALLKQSTQLATPVTELEQSARNIQSTLQGLDASQVEKFTTLFGKGALVAETDAYNFGNAIMGMRNAFGLNLEDMGRISEEFFQVIKISAGMTGDEWAKFSGRVVAGASIAGATMEEMNALTVLMTRQGATPATNVRHLSQFLMQLRNPTQEALPFWENIGLDAKTLRTAGFSEIMGKLLAGITEAGGLRQIKPGETMAMEEDFEFMPKDMGKGEGLLMDLFGRMESRRAALVVLSQILNPPKEGAKSYDELLGIFDKATNDAEELNEAVDKALDFKRIQQAGIAMRNAFTEALVPFQPQIMGAASAIVDKSDPRYVQAAAGVAGAYGLYRFTKFGVEGIRGASRYLKGAGVVGVGISAASSAAPQGSFASPFFVIVMNSGGGLFSGRRGKDPSVPGGGGGGTPRPGGPMSRGERLRNSMRPSGGAGRGLARGGGVLGIGLLAAELLLPGASEKFDSSDELVANVARFRRGHGLGRLAAGPGGPGTFAEISNSVRDHGLRMSGQRGAGIHVSADISPEAKRLLDIKITANDGKRKRVNVPTGHNAFQGGATPQFRGKDSVPRGGL